MKLIESSGSYEINDTEYFYNLDSPSYCPTKIKAYIPKLMAKMAKAAPAKSKAEIPTTMFCNSKDCRVSPTRIVSLQNFVTLTKPSNLSPSFYSTSAGGRMIANKKHILKVSNKDIRQMHFIEDK